MGSRIVYFRNICRITPSVSVRSALSSLCTLRLVSIPHPRGKHLGERPDRYTRDFGARYSCPSHIARHLPGVVGGVRSHGAQWLGTAVYAVGEVMGANYGGSRAGFAGLAFLLPRYSCSMFCKQVPYIPLVTAQPTSPLRKVLRLCSTRP